jgi:hypothetical protein
MFSSYNNGTVTFEGYNATFADVVEGEVLPVTMVKNFDYGDYIDLGVYPPVPSGTGFKIEPAYNGEVIDRVVFYFNDSFNIQTGDDGAGGVFVQAPPVFDIECLAEGSLVATPDGERPVEGLAAGDLILCHAGGQPVARAVVASRRTHCDLTRGPAGHAAAPVRIAAEAFGPGAPRRDLLMSPNHAIYAEGVLVPARHLVNGWSIVREAGRAVIDYVHIEVDRHDIMAADGLLVETRLPPPTLPPTPTKGRWSEAWDAAGCAPLAVTGPAFDRVRARLSRRAAADRARTPITPA